MTWLRRTMLGLILVGMLSPACRSADELSTLLDGVRKALLADETDRALELASKAVKLAPGNAQVRYVRATVYAERKMHQEAIADCTAALKLDPRAASALNLRGSEYFKQGRIQESVADFDRYVELKPEAMPAHWQRGISLYYVGRYEDGVKQFKAYEQKDTNDVENAVWHFLCLARKEGVAKARRAMLKIGRDQRVPMMAIYDLYAGKATPDEVMKAVKEGDPKGAELKKRLFYAHLYLGLYAEVSGDRKKALEHMTEAAEKYRIGHYMGDVAKVHRDLLMKGT